MDTNPRILRALESASPHVVVAVSAAMIAVLGIADVWTGAEVSSSVFYTLPVGTAAWYAGSRPGVALGFLAATVWFYADIAAGAAYSAGWIPVWNAAVRLAFFLIIARLLVLLRAALDGQRALAEIDSLTGLANSRAFLSAVHAEVARSARYGGAVSLAYVDLDGFKGVNDRFGHAVGDDVLETVGRVMRESVRTTDVPARLGGDEFAVLFPETGERPVRDAADKLRETLEAAVATAGWPVGFSMGVVTSANPRDAETLVQEADALMYEVKRSGKGRTSYRRSLSDGGAPGS